MLDSGKLHPINPPLIMTSGRPSTKIQLNLNDHEDFLGTIRNLCKFPSTKDKIKSLCTKLNEILLLTLNQEQLQFMQPVSPLHKKITEPPLLN